MSHDLTREPHAFATRDSPAWARFAASSLLSAPEGRVIVAFLAPLVPLVLLLGAEALPSPTWPFLVAAVGVAYLLHRVLLRLTTRAARLPGVLVEAAGRRRLVPVLLVLRGWATPEADALVDRLLRDQRLAAAAVHDLRPTSGALLAEVERETYASRDPDPSLRRDVLRALTLLPLDAEWLPHDRTARTFEVLRDERRGDLSRFLADVDSGTPVEWAARRLARRASTE